ncbi:MAG: heterocyst frequency control protein PatD [Prochloraceae cyanobacterium]
MLPLQHDRIYRQLLNALLKLQNLSTADNLDLASLEKQYALVKEIFQTRALSLTEEGLDGAIASRWLSVQTEINRAIRLLQNDIIFLRSARQPATRQKRLKTVCDRIEQLIGYCRVLLPETEP